MSLQYLRVEQPSTQLSTPHYHQLHQLHPTTYLLPTTYYYKLLPTVYLLLPFLFLSSSFTVAKNLLHSTTYLLSIHTYYSYLPTTYLPTTYYLPTYYLPTTYPSTIYLPFFSITSLPYYPPPYLLLIITTTYLLPLNFPTPLLFFISN